MSDEKKKCIELIKSFIDERLDGDIQRFYDYDLDLLEKDEKYGAYDPDNSRIANAIYVVLWGDSLPNLITLQRQQRLFDYKADSTYGGGATIYVVDATYGLPQNGSIIDTGCELVGYTSNKFGVFMVEAGAGFFSAGATITLK